MKINVKQLSVILSAILVLAGAILRIYAYKTGCMLMLISTLYLCLYFLIETVKGIKNKSGNLFALIFQLIVALTSIVICAKYIYSSMGYLLGLAIIPLFIICATIYWIKEKRKTIGLTAVSIIYLLLCIPMFANFHDTPFIKYYIYYYPQQYMECNNMGIKKDFNFRTFCYSIYNHEDDEEITELAIQAHILSVYEERYEEAIEIYRQIVAIQYPPNEYMHYKLADCYIHTGQYELAISTLDKSIQIEPTNANNYNLRGFMFYKLKNRELALKDVEKSLQLDSTIGLTYVNQTLIYLDLYNDPHKADEAMKKAELYDYELTLKFSHVKEEIQEKLAKE